jgi:transposase
MIRGFSITNEERAILKELQKTVKDRWQYVRVTTLIFLDAGYTLKVIQEILGIDDNTIREYVSKFLDSDRDIESLLNRNYSASSSNGSKLTMDQLELLETEIKENLYTTAKEIQEFVKTRFDVSYSENGIISILHKLDFSYKQTKQIPCELDPKKQEEFIKQFKELNQKVLTGLNNQGKKENSAIYFTDGVHPTHNTRSTYAWIKKGQEKELETVSGRDRVNINGASNANNPSEVITIQGETINADNTKLLYQKIIDQNPDKDKIYIISDNARYYRNKELNEWIKGTKIQQIFLPPYSPNLNIIERLWKFMRKKVINTKFYRTKKEFEDAITQFFENIQDYKSELESLMTLNFHVFKKS